jgi:hypothetical protein
MSNEPEKRSEWWMSPEDLAKVAAGHREMVAIQAMNLPVIPLPPKKRDWIKEAEKLPYTRPHAWEQLYSDSIEIIDPELFEELNQSGEFESFVKVKVSEALDSYQLYLHNDMDPQSAKELALSELMGMDTDDDEEEYEADVEDEEKKKTKMALQVGMTISKNGAQYRLNENHRWESVNQGGQQQPQAAQPQQRTQPQPQTARPQQAPQKPQPKAQERPHLKGIDPQAIALASSEGDTPQHRTARKKVSVHYLKNIAKSYDHKTNTMQPLDRAKVVGMLKGVDLSKPVLLGPPPEIPPPGKMVQWQAKGGYRGSYFSVPGTVPEQLGIHPKAKAWTAPGQPVLPRQQTVFATKNAKLDRVSFLHSTAAPTIDTWSVPGESHEVAGGGPQWYIPVAAHPQVRIPKVNE